MGRIGAIALLLAGSAGPALAQCLDGSVLSRGLTVTYDNGDVTNIRRTSGGYQMVDEFVGGEATPFRLIAHRGIYFVEEFEPDAFGQPVPGTGLKIRFEVDPATLPEPEAGVIWSGSNTNVFDDGTVRPEEMIVSFVQGPPLDVPGCSYEMVLTDVMYNWGPEGSMQLQYGYLPAIGTAVLLSSQFEGEDLFSYVVTSLEPLRK